MKSVREKLQNSNIIEDFLNGMSLRKVAKKYEISVWMAKDFLNKNNIDTSRRYYRMYKYDFNEHWLDNLDSEEKYYFLGLFGADGSINKENYNAVICLIQEDKSLLEQLNKIIENTRPIKDVLRKTGFRKEAKVDSYFMVSGKYICQRLTDLGFPPNKTLTLEFPNYIPNEFLPAFIRGYLDGDGSITLKTINKNKYMIKINFVGSKKFIKGLYDKLIENGFACILDDKRSENYSLLAINQLDSAVRFLEWIYKDATIKMDRKYKKYQEFLEHRDLTQEDFGSKKRRYKDIYPLIFKDFENGMNITELAKKYNMKWITIWRNLRKNGYRTGWKEINI